MNKDSYRIAGDFPLIVVSRYPDSQERFIAEFIKNAELPGWLVFRIRPIKDEIAIDQIRLIKKEVAVSMKKSRLFILYSFDRASIEAQNSFLKTLEETKNSYFILLVENGHRLLPTIQSRCQTIILDRDLNKNQPKLDVSGLIQQIRKKPGYSFFSNKLISGISKDEVIKIIDQIIEYFSDNLLTDGLTSARILKECLSVRQLLITNNLNPQLTIDNLLIFIGKTYSMKHVACSMKHVT
jgi:hypothetical protein